MLASSLLHYANEIQSSAIDVGFIANSNWDFAPTYSAQRHRHQVEEAT